MRIVRSLRAMQAAAAVRRKEGVQTAFIPTLGCLHEGHMSLVRKARTLVGDRGRVVVSIFVNPTQFGPGEDLARYPRTLAEDTRLCRAAGVDVLFAPSNQEMYPSGAGKEFSTFVVEESLSAGLEGAARPGHFRGVTTVVAKLLNLVRPDVAVFGAKDYQQAIVVKRMVRDLNFPVKVVVAPTVREPNGLAMSSRNRYLSRAERAQAGVLWMALRQARTQVRAAGGLGVPAGRLRAELTWLIETRPGIEVEYIEFFDPETLRSVRQVKRPARMALAVRIGATRLIDNARL